MKQALSKLFLFLGKGLSEDNGQPSQIRLTVFLTFTILIPVIAFGFVWVALKYEAQIILYLTTLIGFLSGLIGMKVWQKGKENEPPK
jgi:hypothetical protein